MTRRRVYVYPPRESRMVFVENCIVEHGGGPGIRLMMPEPTFVTPRGHVCAYCGSYGHAFRCSSCGAPWNGNTK